MLFLLNLNYNLHYNFVIITYLNESQQAFSQNPL